MRNSKRIDSAASLSFAMAMCLGIALGLALALLNGCASASLENLWKDPAYQAPPLTKILVVAVRKEAARRRIWEDAFTAELAKHGVAAMPSYRLYPAAVPDTGQIMESVATGGYDGLLIVRVLPSINIVTHVPGYVLSRPDWCPDNFCQGYYPYYYEEVHPGYTQTTSIAQRAIEVWSTGKNGHLVWTAISNSEESNTGNTWAQDVVSVTAKELTLQKIIPPAR